MTVPAGNIQETMNQLGKERAPFLFLIDFELKNPVVLTLDNVNPNEILYDLNGIKNFKTILKSKKKLLFKVYSFSKERYVRVFQQIQKNIMYGNSFLLNLTFPSRIETNYSLKELFYNSVAKYKIWYKDQFVSFSPEIFIQTAGRTIRSFPMKGTIDASKPHAREKLLANEKEKAEHATVVDLIRNDISMVAKQVEVNRFRYIDHIKTHKNEILQMSSEIRGILPENYLDTLGDLMYKMLPAGSVSGAPKKKTLEIIREAEYTDRGFYTGIVGIFDGKNIDSGVLIRFIEKNNDGLFYRSGGGITTKSNCEDEYRELIQKIYVPFT